MLIKGISSKGRVLNHKWRVERPENAHIRRVLKGCSLRPSSPAG